MKQLVSISLLSLFAVTHCTQNSTLLNDTANELKNASTAGSATSSSGSKLWVVGGTSGALSANLSTVLSYSV